MRADVPLYLFARAPCPGQAKTRLQPSLGAGGAAALAERMLRHSARVMAAGWPGPLVLAAAPDADHPLFRELAKTHELGMTAQRGADLGERMLNALAEGIGEAGGAAVAGSDIPALDTAILAEAHQVLARGDSVIGPAADGGFYFIGLRSAEPALFEGVQWGGGDVCAEVERRGRALGIDFYRLPVLRDIDRPEDLELARDTLERIA